MFNETLRESVGNKAFIHNLTKMASIEIRDINESVTRAAVALKVEETHVSAVPACLADLARPRYRIRDTKSYIPFTGYV